MADLQTLVHDEMDRAGSPSYSIHDLVMACVTIKVNQIRPYDVSRCLGIGQEIQLIS